jgi:hypothetical protein
LNGNLDGATYLTLLQENLMPAFAASFPNPLDSPHYAVIVRRYLDEVFPNRWIGRRGQDLRILLLSNFFMGISQE